MSNENDSGTSDHDPSMGVCNTLREAQPTGGRTLKTQAMGDVIELAPHRAEAKRREGAPRKKTTRTKEGELPEGGEATTTVLRVAFDWVRVLYCLRVTGQVWKWLERLYRAGEPLVLDLPGEDKTLELVVSRGPKGMMVAGREGSGVRIQVRWPAEYRAPTTQPADPVDATNEKQRIASEIARLRADDDQHGVEVDIQGTLLSASRTGWEVIADVRAMVEAALFAHHGPTETERREKLHSETHIGRFDVAVCTQVSGPGARRWIEDEIFARGNVDEARHKWATRATVPDQWAKDEEKRRMLGGEPRGRTWYLGTNPAFMRVYEKTAHWGNGVAMEALKQTYRDAGWDGVSPVLRVEFQLTRAWLYSQEFKARDGVVVRGNLLTLDEVLSAMPMVCERLSRRYRHLGGSPYKRKEDRPTSPWWHQVTSELCAFRESLDRTNPFVAFRSAKHQRRVDLATERAVRSVVVLEAATGEATEDVIAMILYTRARADWAVDLAELFGNVRRELGLPQVPFPEVRPTGRYTETG